MWYNLSNNIINQQGVQRNFSPQCIRYIGAKISKQICSLAHRHVFIAIIFIILGIVVLLNAFGIAINVHVWGIIGGIILLAIGLKLLIKPRWCPMCSGHWKMHSKIHGQCQCAHKHEPEETQDIH